MRNLWIALVLLLWLLLGWKMCTDYNKCCSDALPVREVEPAVVAPVVEKPQAPCEGLICFEKNSCLPQFCDGWMDFRDSLVASVGENQKLIITGYSSPSESNDSDFKNLGLCRADTIQKTLSDLLGGLSFEISGQLRVGSNSGGSCDRVGFRVVGSETKINNSTLIYFPTNSTDKLADASVETYLKQVANQVKDSNQRIRLTGHTDNQGSEAYNMELGRKRANIIKRYLIDQGVASSKIITNSRGEEVPVASNNSPEGRAKNRRTELQILD